MRVTDPAFDDSYATEFLQNLAQSGEDPVDIVLRAEGQRDLAFTGWRIAHVDSRKNLDERWTELELWITKGGTFIAHEIGVTHVGDEVDRHKAEVCADLEEVEDFFGHGWLAKELYDAAGIEIVRHIE